MRICKVEMVRVLKQEPAFAARFMSYLLARNSRVEEDLIDHLFNSSEKRLAQVLLIPANFGKDQEPEPIFPRSVRRCGRRWLELGARESAIS
jgi:CRP/FNR family transcriptional regulator, cyclic AMP receptor protein